MSYEGEMLQRLKMPPQEEVEEALLKTLIKHNGVIKEFGEGEEVVEEIANDFSLNEEQLNAYLETIYRRENRVKKSNLWHRLLFRAADNLSKQKLISRPTQTVRLTNRREWMLTENGYDKALHLVGIPSSRKEKLSIKSYEVEKLVKQLKRKQKPENYNPISKRKEEHQTTRVSILRNRSFRQAVIEAYECRCAVCGLKIYSPKTFQWEVEAAHIVPRSFKGKDDIWNGLSLCHFHHWAFDVGWYSFDQEFRIVASKYLGELPNDMGKIWNYDFMGQLSNNRLKVDLPENQNFWPDIKAIKWHRDNVLQIF